MINVICLINTYKRNDKLLRLLQEINEKHDNCHIEVLIFEDYSRHNYSECIQYLENEVDYQFTWIKTKKHYGKKEYWKIINEAYRMLKNKKFDYLVHLPDDISLTDKFFIRAITIFNTIRDKKKACLNLLHEINRNNPGWTNIKPREFGNVINTGWVDMCYICTDKMLKALNYEIHAINPKWSGNPKRSSGVGMQISKRLVKTGLSIYQVKTSLVMHGIHKSMMHPKERIINPLITKHMKIVATVASMPERKKSFKHTVNSIINQVDEIHVYLNNYSSIPDYLNNKKIKVFKSQDEIGDIGDVGKFYTAGTFKGYHFTIDDDLIYPLNYINKMIAKIELYERKKIISCHGRIFPDREIKSYYHDFKKCVQCLKNNNKDIRVHVGGTGVMAFYSGTIKVSIADFEAANMADIWMGIIAEKQNVEIMAIEHPNGWIKESFYDRNYTIYNFCHKNDGYQTEVVNNNAWSVL